jgi:hypothetical protein
MNCIKHDNGKTTETREPQEELLRHVEQDLDYFVLKTAAT